MNFLVNFNQIFTQINGFDSAKECPEEFNSLYSSCFEVGEGVSEDLAKSGASEGGVFWD